MMDRCNHYKTPRYEGACYSLYNIIIYVYYTASVEPIWRVVNAYIRANQFRSLKLLYLYIYIYII